jgi:DNA-nicking Smr family endonuclease
MQRGDGKRRAPRLRLPSREELNLWRHVTADVKPRAGAKKTEAEPPPTPAAPADAAALLEKFSASPAPGEPAPKPAAKPTLPPIAPLERKLKRHLSSGRAHVDDVLDLHGMTQDRAHMALEGFIVSAARSGALVVLVITGKGDPRGGGDWGQNSWGLERGVLRRNVPHWLRAPSLRPYVLSIEEAGRPHGGAGALYVRLRRVAAPK